MVKVRKSPNMISTTGRIPVIAAPTATPVNPASEMGVSMTRSLPNSSTSPVRTLNGVPASATSSPKMQMRSSRRISSANASRTACANVISRSGINVITHFIRAGVRRINGELHCRFHLDSRLARNLFQVSDLGTTLFQQPLRKDFDGIAIRSPKLFFLLQTIVFAVDISHMVAAVAIGIALQECRAAAGARPVHQAGGDFVHRANILSIDPRVLDAKCRCATENRARRGFAVMCVFVVEIVFAKIDDRQLPQLRQIHHFVKRSLPQSAFAEEAHGHAVGLHSLRCECRTGGDAHAAADNRVRAQISGRGIGNVHRSTFAFAVSGFFAQQFRKHAIRRRALGQAMAMPAMRAGNVVVAAKRLADTHRDRLFAAIKMSQPRHQRAGIKLVHLLFEGADTYHLPVGVKPLLPIVFDRNAAVHLRYRCHGGHLAPPSVTGVDTPDMEASTSNMQAKSYFAQPMPRAAVKNSLLAAVVGSGTSSCRPRSIAKTISFCIMLQSNQASSGCCSTNGPRYLIMGEATPLFVSTSTSTSRAMPLFSASSTPSLKANICTARLRLMAIFIDSARPLSPTWVTFGPMSCKSGFTFSNVSLRPPTITDSLPSCSVITLPETGESTMSAPSSRTFVANVRLALGLIVLMSMKIFPAPKPASSPSAPSVIAVTAAVLVTIAKVKSELSATARGESAHFIPLSISRCAFARVRLYPVTVWPLSSNRLTIWLPITPRPTNPTFAIALLHYS